VNDCSPDDARPVLADLACRDPRVVVINHTRNFGSQASFTSGMKLSTGDAVVLLDGDLQDPPELIEAFFHARVLILSMAFVPVGRQPPGSRWPTRHFIVCSADWPT
jgi:glycosyltransferase involved in cell wall biosynthesis